MEMEEDATERESRAAPVAGARFPLARDGMGNPIEVPPNAVAWRVRRGGGRRGRPRHVFDPETGRQLEVPLGATVEDLIDEGCTPDRYLLYPIDAEGQVIPGIVAVTEVSEGASDEDGDVQPTPMQSALLSAIHEQQSMIREQGATIRHQADCLTRSLEATTSGYGRVRPEPPPQVIIDAPPAPEGAGSFKPEQIAEIVNIVKAAIDLFRGGGGAAPPQAGGGP
jgi:hypothetical protein